MEISKFDILPAWRSQRALCHWKTWRTFNKVSSFQSHLRNCHEQMCFQKIDSTQNNKWDKLAAYLDLSLVYEELSWTRCRKGTLSQKKTAAVWEFFPHNPVQRVPKWVTRLFCWSICECFRVIFLQMNWKPKIRKKNYPFEFHFRYCPEMYKAADIADISVLFFPRQC